MSNEPLEQLSPSGPAATTHPNQFLSQTMRVGDVGGGWNGPSVVSDSPSVVQIQEMTVQSGPCLFMVALAVGTAGVTVTYSDGSFEYTTVTVIPVGGTTSSQTIKVGDIIELPLDGWDGPAIVSSNPSTVLITVITIGTEPGLALMTGIAVGTAVVTMTYQNGSIDQQTVNVVAS